MIWISSYRAPPPPADLPPDPEICEAELAEIQAVRKIMFEPGSATIAAESRDTMDDIADLLTQCGEIRLEIQGHTDSQGRESMNQQLSQGPRPSPVLKRNWRARRVLTSSYVATGYGEASPIAGNGHRSRDAKRNRRIEFRLIRPEPIHESQTTLEAIAAENPIGVDDATEQDAVTGPETPSGEGSDNEQN